MNAIVKNSNFVLEPREYNAISFSQELKNYGLNVSLPVSAPSQAVDFGNGLKILPVEIEHPNYDPATQVEVAGAYTIEADKVVRATTIRDKTEDELNPPPSQEQIRQWTLENKYLESTRDLILLAGQTPTEEWPKLEDVQIEEIAKIAFANNVATATMLLSALSYSFFQLKFLGVPWENITYHEMA